ncbi:MAG: type II secretion system GspH family protein [Gemmataceae bacterium]|nr:type II secretion system GspH family protein [Gemmataceae bacterium]
MTRRTGTGQGAGTGRLAGGRAGFTLIELLVVIAIIAVLVGLTSAAVMRVRSSATRAKNRNQIEQIDVAAKSFCGQEVNSKIGFLPPPPFNLKSQYSANEPEASYLKQLFPNLNLGNTGLPNARLEDGNQVALFFLTGGEVTNYTGFSNNPQQPFTPGTAGENRRGPYLQLQASMYNRAANGMGQLIDPYGTPYVIFIAGPKGAYTNATGGTQTMAGMSPFSRGTPVKFEVQKGPLQIISAGENQQFGTGGNWGAGIAGPGQDDVSNFSSAQLGAGPQ